MDVPTWSMLVVGAHHTDYHVRPIGGRLLLLEAMTMPGRRNAKPGSLHIRGVLIRMAGIKVSMLPL